MKLRKEVFLAACARVEVETSRFSCVALDMAAFPDNPFPPYSEERETYRKFMSPREDKQLSVTDILEAAQEVGDYTGEYQKHLRIMLLLFAMEALC